MSSKKQLDINKSKPLTEEIRTEELLSMIIPPKEYVLEHG
jgi:hypothetical protein